MGDPGSGKSAFVNYLSLCLAGEHLQSDTANLTFLTEPLPNLEGDDIIEEVEVNGKEVEKPVRQPWQHGALLPLRIILRDFSASSYFPKAHESGDACHIMQSAELVRNDPDRWREVVVLIGGIKTQKEPGPAWDLVAELTAEVDGMTEPEAWGMRFAAEIVAESLAVEKLNRTNQRKLKALQAGLPSVLGSSLLPLQERAKVGRYLAVMGDPRPSVNDVDAMPFCYVPAGKFWMGRGQWDTEDEAYGDENPAGEYDLNYAYWLAQHPVTVAQFRQFVEDNPAFQLGDARALQGDANTPVVWVSQYEAMAFCHWLTQRWQAQGTISTDWRVTLPNEPEWEKAARGGLDIPKHPVVCSVDALTEQRECILQNNDLSQRSYPFGNAITDDLVNYNGNIGDKTTQGLYPQGISPYGCHDMAGNIWEWTRSVLKSYPYPKVHSDEWTEQEQVTDESACVLRGGAFYRSDGYVRCAVRYDSRPRNRLSGLGFRVALSPSTLNADVSERWNAE